MWCPRKEEADAELADAVQIVLAKDRLVQAGALAATLQEGRVARQEGRRLALQDVWYVPGVRMSWTRSQ